MPSARTSSSYGGSAGARGSWPPRCSSSWSWRAWSAGASTTPSQRAAASAAYSAALAKIAQDKAAARAEFEQAGRERARALSFAGRPGAAQLRDTPDAQVDRPRGAWRRRLPSAELSDLAIVIAGFRSVDTAKAEELVAKLEPLAAPDRPFHASVIELQALVAARKGDLKRARELWTRDHQGSRRAAGRPAARRRRCSTSTAPAEAQVESWRTLCVRSLPGPAPPARRVAVRLRRRLVRQEEAAAAGRAHRRLHRPQRLEPDKDVASVQIVLPAPMVNDSWPQSGGFANYAMQQSGGRRFAADHLDGRCRRGLDVVAHPDHAAGRGRGQGLRQGRAEHRLGLQRRYRPDDLARDAQAREGARRPTSSAAGSPTMAAGCS